MRVYLNLAALFVGLTSSIGGSHYNAATNVTRELHSQMMCINNATSGDKSGTNGLTETSVLLELQVASIVANRVTNETERRRFELLMGFHPYRFSKPAHSTALPPLQE